MTRSMERIYPVLTGSIAGLGAVLLKVSGVDVRVRDVLEPSLNVSAIVIGFMATAKAILFSIGHRRVVKQLRKTKYYEDIVDYLKAGIRWAFVLAVTTVIYILFDLPPSNGLWSIVLTSCWVFIAVTMGFSCHRVVTYFAELLLHE